MKILSTIVVLYLSYELLNYHPAFLVALWLGILVYKLAGLNLQV